MLPFLKNKRGFTLIELLVVIAILSVLLVIVLVAINPAQQTRAARNTQRRADVLTILNAVNQYFVANGSFPGNLGTIATATPQSIDSLNVTLDGPGFCSALVPSYVAALPFDPFDSTSGHSYSFTSPASGGCPTTWNTGYKITRNTGDRITVSAPEGANDGSVTIQATR